MVNFEFTKTDIQGLFVQNIDYDLTYSSDNRGFFKYFYSQSEIAKVTSKEFNFQQGNHSFSKEGVLRGLHLESWSKLVYVVSGKALIVVADTRQDSRTFGKYVSIEVGDFDSGRKSVLIEEGLANSFYCFSDVHYLNNVSSEFDPNKRFGIKFDDPDLSIPWPNKDPILSDVDRNLPYLRDLLT